MKPNVFLDLDGVMYDFDRHFKEQFNAEPPSRGGVSDEEMWRLVYEHGSFFETMPMMDGAKEFFFGLLEINIQPIILTAAGKTHYEDVARQKKIAVRRDLTKDTIILAVPGSKYKHHFLQNEGDILIDDYQKNIMRWIMQGGWGIHFEGDWDYTRERIILGLNSPSTKTL